MRKFAVVGNPIKHSFSPNYFAEKFEREKIDDAQYSILELKDISTIGKKIVELELTGLNITIPFKQSIIGYLDSLGVAAAEIGAVNTVKVVNNKLVGFNTDYLGFSKSIAALVKPKQQALIFGSGGSSLAVKYALSNLGISFKTVSRNGKNGIVYEELDTSIIQDHQLLINCTPVGMYPKIDHSLPIPFTSISENHICFDLIYRPSKTKFMQNAEECGAIVKNGLEMLEIQAEESWKIWNM